MIEFFLCGFSTMQYDGKSIHSIIYMKLLIPFSEYFCLFFFFVEQKKNAPSLLSTLNHDPCGKLSVGCKEEKKRRFRVQCGNLQDLYLKNDTAPLWQQQCRWRCLVDLLFHLFFAPAFPDTTSFPPVPLPILRRNYYKVFIAFPYPLAHPLEFARQTGKFTTSTILRARRRDDRFFLLYFFPFHVNCFYFSYFTGSVAR